MNKLAYLFIALLLSSLVGCAKPTPEEICSPEWIQPRVDRAMKQFEKSTNKALKTLRKAGNKVEAGGEIGPLRMLSVLIALQSAVDNFVDGQALKDIRTLGKTCNDPKLVARSFRAFLKDKGAPDTVIDILEDLQEYQSLEENPE